MDGLKGLAESLEHVLYEVLGLVVPGAAMVLAVAWALDPEAAGRLVTLAEAHRWFALAGAYVAGYPVQSVSRPATTLWKWVLTRPVALVAFVGRALPPASRARAASRIDALVAWLYGRHGYRRAEAEPSSTAAGQPSAIVFRDVMGERWATRLGLPAGTRFTDAQVTDLCYSALSADERKSLVRFRAATSLARGVAATLAVASVVLLLRCALQPSSWSWDVGGTLLVASAAFLGFVERSDWYERTRSSALFAQSVGVAVDVRCAASVSSVLGTPSAPPGGPMTATPATALSAPPTLDAPDVAVTAPSAPDGVACSPPVAPAAVEAPVRRHRSLAVAADAPTRVPEPSGVSSDPPTRDVGIDASPVAPESVGAALPGSAAHTPDAPHQDAVTAGPPSAPRST